MTKTLTVRRKPIKCPNCGFRPVSTILYGMPFFDEEMQKDLDDKIIVLGGCCITGFDPIWKCTNCDTDFYLEGLTADFKIPDLEEEAKQSYKQK